MKERGVGLLQLKFENVTQEEVKRYEKTIYELFTQGFFTFKNGKVIIHFNERSEMSMIQYDYVKWRKATEDKNVWRCNDQKKSTVDLPKDIILGNIESTLTTK
jgi:trehalose utilization protein